MRVWLCIVVLSLACHTARSHQGFNEPEVRELLDAYAASHSVCTEDIIHVALAEVGNADFVRFFVTDNGQLYFMVNESLHAVAVVQVLGGQTRIFVTSVLEAKSLSKNAKGIVFESESMTGEQALSGVFCFDYFQDATEGLDMLICDMKATTTVHAARRPSTDRHVARPKKRATLASLAEVASSL